MFHMKSITDVICESNYDPEETGNQILWKLLVVLCFKNANWLWWEGFDMSWQVTSAMGILELCFTISSNLFLPPPTLTTKLGSFGHHVLVGFHDSKISTFPQMVFVSVSWGNLPFKILLIYSGKVCKRVSATIMKHLFLLAAGLNPIVLQISAWHWFSPLIH